MASVYLKRGKFWARLRGDKQPGKWSSVPTGETDRAEAMKFAEAAQKAIDKRPKPVNKLSYRAWITEWLEKREESGADWKKDKGRLSKHVLPVLGDVNLTELTPKHLVDLVHALRFKTKLANRTVRNVYSVIAASLRDAALDGRIDKTPCMLTDVQLGEVADKDPEWRSGALFDRDEAETLISDPRIPLDRRMVYAFGLLAGLRIGEAAALRWRHYDHAKQPLGQLTVALSYATHRSKMKDTKTGAVRFVPVHPTLAMLLDLWRRAWPAANGSEPGPEDLIVPLPPDVIRTSRTGERFRGWDYTGRRWREVDLPLLGWRARSVYDTKSTFITLAIEDGANPAIIRDRVTHTRSRRDAFSGYDRGPHWVETCNEVAKLRIRLFATTVLPPAELPGITPTMGSGGGLRTRKPGTPCTPLAHVSPQEDTDLRTTCDIAFGALTRTGSRSRATTQEDDE
jgi:integrase